ncbi:MAG: hypothetical protein IJB89_06035 [Akkermansia sp.]|nr:hypothetical protein [Akkermansia sp.]MBQ9828921.1 hypothetical protein [Akkermansia sp.]
MAEQSNPGGKALAIGAILGLAAAGLAGYSYMDKVVEPETNISASKSGESLTAEADLVKESLKRDRTVVDVAPEGAKVNGQPRIAPLFFSTELWQITLDSEKKNTVVDIYDPAAPSIHGDIPNTWFIANNIADALGRSDGRVLDSDNDGFTNEEEFNAKTCPSASTSYPDLVQASGATPKLEVVKTNVARATIVVDNMFGMATTTPQSVNIRIFAKHTDMTPVWKGDVKPGGSFDLPGEKLGRFTVVRFDKAEFPSFSGMSKENVVIVRDNVTASPNKEFRIRAGSKTAAGSKDYGTPNEKGYRLSDTSVILRVTAGSAVGKPEGEIRTQPYASFVIPGGKADGSELKATLESIDASGSVNIRLDGAESPVNVPKASGKK